MYWVEAEESNWQQLAHLADVVELVVLHLYLQYKF